MADGAKPRRIQSIQRAWDVLRLLDENGAMRITSLAEETGLDPGTLHPYLATLCDIGLVGREGEKYKLGLAIVPLSERTKAHVPVYRAGKEETDKLARKHDAVSHLIAPFKDKLVVLHEMFGEGAIGQKVYTKKRGRPTPHMHCSGAGKTILAHMPESRVRTIVERYGLPEYTENTITDIETLFEELERIREQGFALNDEEFIKGSRGVTAPIFGDGEQVLGTISVSGSANRWKGRQFREELPESVMRSANAIEMNIHSSETDDSGE